MTIETVATFKLGDFSAEMTKHDAGYFTIRSKEPVGTGDDVTLMSAASTHEDEAKARSVFARIVVDYAMRCMA